MKKEQWIEDVLRSAKAIHPVAANPYTANRVQARLDNEKRTINKMPLRWVYISVTAMVLLIAANVLLWQNKKSSSADNSIQQVISEYGLNNHDFYSMNYSK